VIETSPKLSHRELESLGFLRPVFELLPNMFGWSQVAQRPIQLPHLHAPD